MSASMRLMQRVSGKHYKISRQMIERYKQIYMIAAISRKNISMILTLLNLL